MKTLNSILPDKTDRLPAGVDKIIRAALREDIGTGDVTTESILSMDAGLQARILAKQDGVLAGLDVAGRVFFQVDERIILQRLAAEGETLHKGQVVAELSGTARCILTAERTALNFLGRMSGIATLTSQYVQAVAGTGAIILDTRKTAPGLRVLDKLAVRRGGGQNHRSGLFDMILIKDNHIDISGSLAEAVKRARAAGSGLEIEVEARSLEDVQTALDLGVKRILLDNMSLAMMRRAVALNTGMPAGKRARLEASGNVNLETVRAIAQTGVDFISSGSLTHSAPVFDFSLDVVKA